MIGKGGATLKRIIASTFTKIDIPKSDENETKFVEIVITGDDLGVELAREEIMAIVKKQTSNYREKVVVEKLFHRFLVPKISLFEKQNKVKIHIPPNYDRNEPDANEEILLVGEMDDVIAAVEKLKALVNEMVYFRKLKLVRRFGYYCRYFEKIATSVHYW